MIVGLFSWGKKKNKENEEDEAEDSLIPELDSEIFVKQMVLNSARDFILLKQELMQGNLMVVNLQNLVKIAQGPTKDRRPLRSQLNLVKKYCMQYGGSIMKLKKGMIVVSPNEGFDVIE